jgi:hypothetical protein
MPDIRVTVTSELRFDLKVMALDQGKTLAKLVTDILASASSSHHWKKSLKSNPIVTRKRIEKGKQQ